MRKWTYILILLVFSSFIHSSISGKVKIKWKKVNTAELARREMDRVIQPGSDYDTDLKLLMDQRHSFCEGQGDTVIYFHSPEVTVSFMISRKWMYTFHFIDRKLQSYAVEKGLTGP